MKHIEDALRIADEERAAAKERVDWRTEPTERVILLGAAKTLPPLRTPPVEHEAPSANDSSAPEHSSISFSKSRSIDVSAERLESARIITGKGEDPATRAYKLLRTQAIHRMQAKSWRTVGVVSPSASEGKTLTAINLGVAIATSVQHTVMVVDCDWRQPSVHTYFDDHPKQDVINFLDDGVPLSDVIVNPGLPRFCYIPCRAPVPQSSERLGSPRMGRFVDELRNRYQNRYVLFDLPPMLLTDDALSFLPHVDCVLVVVEEGRTDSAALEQVLKLIGPDRLLGTVLNKSSVSLPGY